MDNAYQPLLKCVQHSQSYSSNSATLQTKSSVELALVHGLRSRAQQRAAARRRSTRPSDWERHLTPTTSLVNQSIAHS